MQVSDSVSTLHTLCVCVCVFVLYRAAVVTRQFPGVMFMVDHCGLPFERDEATMRLWREGEA